MIRRVMQLRASKKLRQALLRKQTVVSQEGIEAGRLAAWKGEAYKHYLTAERDVRRDLIQFYRGQLYLIHWVQHGKWPDNDASLGS